MISEHRSHAAGLHKRCAIASPRQCRDNAIRRSIPPTTTLERCKCALLHTLKWMRPPTCVPEQHVGNRMWFGAKEPSVMRASMRRALIQITGGLEVAKKGELKSATWIRQRGQMGKRDPHGEIREGDARAHQRRMARPRQSASRVRGISHAAPGKGIEVCLNTRCCPHGRSASLR
jgi:hypothetical protein